MLSTTVSIYSQNLMAQNNEQEVDTLLAARIHDSINNELTKPIMVAQSMANDEFVIDFIKNKEQSLPKEEAVAILQKYLSRLKNRLSYEAAFVVSDKTKLYYTYKGFNKIVNTKNDHHDIWYQIFVDKNKDYDLDVDTDEMNANNWTVFLNARVLDDNREFLGVCGVGVQMLNLQQMLAQYEKQYGVKINLVDSDNVIQVDTNEINIEAPYFDPAAIIQKDAHEYTYSIDDEGNSTVTKYVQNLGWYLVVKSKITPEESFFFNVIVLNFILFSLMALALTFTLFIVSKRNRTLINYSYKDPLTRLQNRRSYDETLFSLQNSILPQKSNNIYSIDF
ncbi:MAG: cache domain-containing protein [Succinivibrionaceae bacterium]|nr:cache domain-containing protein [Succinivibrionaceae bacterium]